MLNESDFQQMIHEIQDHLAKVINIYTGIVNELDDEHLRLQYMALLQAKQKQREVLLALVALVLPGDDGYALRQGGKAKP